LVKKFQCYSISNNCAEAQLLSFFHALTGCDIIISVFKGGNDGKPGKHIKWRSYQNVVLLTNHLF